jgi:hypothetical protein
MMDRGSSERNQLTLYARRKRKSLCAMRMLQYSAPIALVIANTTFDDKDRWVEFDVVVDGDGDGDEMATMRSRVRWHARPLASSRSERTSSASTIRGALHGRATCDGIVSSAVGLRCPAGRFRDVQRNGWGCPPQLLC